MNVPAEKRRARPMLSTVAKALSYSTKKVKIAIIGDAKAKANRYIFDFDSVIFICFRNEESPKAAGPL